MIKVRRNTFETNSSSMHSISFSGGRNIYPSHLVKDENNYIHTYLGEYGWGPENLYSQEEKLSYLVTMCSAINGITAYWRQGSELDNTIEEIMNCDDFKKIENELKEHTGCAGLIIDHSEGYIDHQSIENNSLTEYLYDNRVDSVLDFVFGPVIVHVDNDNH